MKEMKLRTKLLLGNSIIIAFFIAVAIATTSSINSLVSITNWVEHTHEVVTVTKEITKTLMDMETGERGYLISGNEKYLEPYNNGTHIFKKLINDAKKLVQNRPHRYVTGIAADDFTKGCPGTCDGKGRRIAICIQELTLPPPSRYDPRRPIVFFIPFGIIRPWNLPQAFDFFA